MAAARSILDAVPQRGKALREAIGALVGVVLSEHTDKDGATPVRWRPYRIPLSAAFAMVMHWLP
jgi:hypothetical protein